MKVLIVSSGNGENFIFEKHQAFIYDQVQAIKKNDSSLKVEFFFVKGQGIKGYLNNLSLLKNKITSFKPDVLHAHGGHIGSLCVLQNIVPVVTTFHGSDINNKSTRLLSYFAAFFSKSTIFVSQKLFHKIKFITKNYFIIPCGVDKSIFYPMDKAVAKKKQNIELSDKYFLFTSSFNNTVKNYDLAKKVMTYFPDYSIKEIKNKTRYEVAQLLNGSELLLMTSFSEGSPQITKEALACGKPVVSVDVGDIHEQLNAVNNCRISKSYDVLDIVNLIKEVLKISSNKIDEVNIIRYDSNIIAKKILNIYNSIFYENSKM